MNETHKDNQKIFENISNNSIKNKNSEINKEDEKIKRFVVNNNENENDNKTKEQTNKYEDRKEKDNKEKNNIKKENNKNKDKSNKNKKHKKFLTKEQTNIKKEDKKNNNDNKKNNNVNSNNHKNISENIQQSQKNNENNTINNNISKYGDKNGITKNNKTNKNINSYNEDLKEKNDNEKNINDNNINSNNNNKNKIIENIKKNNDENDKIDEIVENNKKNNIIPENNNIKDKNKNAINNINIIANDTNKNIENNIKNNNDNNNNVNNTNNLNNIFLSDINLNRNNNNINNKDKNDITENNLKNNYTNININDQNIHHNNKNCENNINEENITNTNIADNNQINDNNINKSIKNDNINAEDFQQNNAFLEKNIINENHMIVNGIDEKNYNKNINIENSIRKNEIINLNNNNINENINKNDEYHENNIINEKNLKYNNINFDINGNDRYDENKNNDYNNQINIDIKKSFNENQMSNDFFNSNFLFTSQIHSSQNKISTSNYFNCQIKNDNPKDISNNNIKINNKNFINNNNEKINMNNNINNLLSRNNILDFFPLVGLENVGSTCFMNAILQCLIHIQELSLYFLNEYPNDEQSLNNINSESVTRGQLSKAYYDIVKGVDTISKQNNSYNHYRPKKFKEILGEYNKQFSKYEANDSKDLILYLLQTFHDELNYFGNKKVPGNIQYPDPTLEANVFTYFNFTYNFTNFSKISNLFYGTYENIIICSKCHTSYFSFQKFEYISFSTYKYRNQKFNIMNGFEDMESKQRLEGTNQYQCNKCNKLVNAEIYCKIANLPKYLILNIDYGKDKKNKVNELIFEHEIDLKKYLSIYFGQNSRYRLISICTHIGKSGSTGHYITYCLNKEKNIWYKFNDSLYGMCDKYELKKDSPYLLLYEMIM